MPHRMIHTALFLFWVQLCAGAEPIGQVLVVAPDVYNGVVGGAPDPELAAELVVQGRNAAEAGEASLAIQLASEALAVDPDIARARQVLGYEWVDGVWMTPYQAEQHRRGYTWDARYGWIKPEQLPRLVGGERPLGRRWVTQEVDQRRHTEIEDGWQVRTDHFLVTTNHSPEASARLAAELEGLFQVWRQLFAAFYLDADEIVQRFAGERAARRQRRPMKVFYHRDREGYIEHLRHRQPRIDETLGIYFDTIRESHFFHSDDPDAATLARATLYHEAVHQLFQETTTKGRSPGENANFWVIEGVACYFESLTPLADGRYAIGSGGRLASAAEVGLVLPTGELAGLAQSDFQRQPRLAETYAQAAGLSTMLMHEGDRREAFVAYLREVYGGRPDGDELFRRLETPLSQLDAEYLRFLGRWRENLPAE